MAGFVVMVKTGRAYLQLRHGDRDSRVSAQNDIVFKMKRSQTVPNPSISGACRVMIIP